MGLVMAVVLPAVMALGMILPASWHGLSRVLSRERPSTVVGRLTAANTIAAAGGAILASFFILPRLGLSGSLVLAVVAICGLAATAMPARRLEVIFVGMAVTAGATLGARQLYASAIPQGAELVRRWEGAYGWIEILRRPFDGIQLLRQDVQYGLGADLDIDWERRQGYLPLLLHKNPQDVAYLGVGTGISVSSFVSLPDVRHVDAVELIPEVVEALEYFADANLRFYRDPRCRLHVDDARHFMAHTSHHYDVIVSDLFTPWHSQTGYLYTVEHFSQCRKQLKEGGLFCQWLPLWQLGAVEFEIIADSFRAVYPRTTLWWGLIEPAKPLVCLIGADHPLDLNEATRSRVALLADQSGSRDPWLESPTRVSHLYVGGWPRRYNALLNTDDRPRIEFMAPITHVNDEKLRHERVREYFGEVLARLPQDGVRFSATSSPPVSVIDRIRWQYLRLSVPVVRGRGHVEPPKFLDQNSEASGE
jgi:spermidine synthase